MMWHLIPDEETEYRELTRHKEEGPEALSSAHGAMLSPVLPGTWSFLFFGDGRSLAGGHWLSLQTAKPRLLTDGVEPRKQEIWALESLPQQC